MAMQGRGWRHERYVVLKDLVTGEEVPVWVGLTRDPYSDTGRLVSAIAVGDERTLMFGDSDESEALRDILAATDELLKDAREAGR